MSLRLGTGVMLATGMLVAGCAEPPPPAQVVAPPPQEAPPPPPRVVAPAPRPAPSALRSTYARMERGLLARGLLRRDGGGPDTPFSDAQLARNFLRIALYDEYRRDGDILRAEAQESRLRRWDRPVRVGLVFGDAVPPERRVTDRNMVGQYLRRLSRLTGHSIQMVSADKANYHVLVLDAPALAQAGPRLRALVPGLDHVTEAALTQLPTETLCAVVTFSRGGGHSYSDAIAVIRDEHPPLLRESCIHEELAQGLGLANDSPMARPSIFNDDEEFAYLTTHDELLLKMLYDPRFRSGMSLAEAAPIARQIASELLPPTS